jgi:site-specific DNA-methyltransferase (adenine-specific)
MQLPPTPDEPLLLHGDCLDVLGTMPAASVDVVVTDPPAGIGFMGKPWDSFARYKPRTKRGREVNSMLGGGDLLARAANVLLGLSLSSATDGLPARAEAAALADELRNAARAEPLAPWARGFVVFMVDVWSEVDRVLKPGGWVCSWALPKTADLAGLALRAVGWDVHDSLLHLFGQGMAKAGDLGKRIDAMLGAEREVVGKHPNPNGQRGGTTMGGSWQEAPDVTAPATPEAERWTDWSSQLAPGHEQWLLARKPTRLTYARQVLEHGCGALNIGACRVPRGEADRERIEVAVSQGAGIFASEHTYGDGGRVAYALPGGGSWPKNVVLSEGGEGCPVAALDRQSGTQRDGVAVKRNLPDEGGKPGITAIHSGTQQGPDQGFGGAGGASRYFTRFRYEAKNSDRGAGLREDIRNEHPTPKSVDLMRWLVALLAAKAEHTGGLPAVVLDPFLGSGSTGVACVAERVRFVGIERDAASFEVARSRILTAIGSPELAAEAAASAPAGSQLSLL